MKTLFSVIFFFIYHLSSGQKANDNNNTFKITIPYVPAKLELLNNSKVITTTQVNIGLQKIYFTEIPKGNYKVQISGLGKSPSIIDSIVVSENEFIFTISIDGPCLFDYPKNYIPICPQNHKDSIIPIIYGLVTRKDDTYIKDKKNMKYKYAGCIEFGCDPKFYCKLHEIEF